MPFKVATRSVLFGAAWLIALASATPASAARAPEAPAARGAATPEPLALSLGKAVELGLASDELMRQARVAVEGANARYTQARSAALPQISAGGQYNRNLLLPSFFLPPEFAEGATGPVRVEIGGNNDFNGAVTLTQILWAAGRVSAGLKTANEFLKSYHYQEDATADAVRFQVKQAYYGTLLAAESLRIAGGALKTTEEALRVAKAGFEQGTVSRFDVTRAEVELRNRRAPLVQAQNDLDQALMTLKRRCGIDPSRDVVLSDSLTATERPASLDTMLAAMRRESAEIKALEHIVGARRQLVRIAKAARYPMLNLLANYSVQMQWDQGVVPSRDLIGKSAAVGFAIQIPIFDGLSAKGQIGQAQADARSAELDLERSVHDKELAVRQSYVGLENALTALEGRREGVRLAEEAYRLALVRMKNGLATPLERLDAELAMTTARVQLAQTLYSSEVALAYLELAVGSAGFESVGARRE